MALNFDTCISFISLSTCDCTDLSILNQKISTLETSNKKYVKSNFKMMKVNLFIA